MSDKAGFWQACFLKQTVRRALRIALMVGTALVLINQWEALLGDAVLSWPKLVLTYCVPYLVSSYSTAAHISDPNNA